MRRKRIAFISSTSDLRECCQQVGEAIRRLGDWDWDGMELFGAQDAEPEEICRQRVSGCDVFVGIVGYTYGSVPVGGDKSFCEIEYEAALERGKPRLMFLASRDFQQPAEAVSRASDADRQRQFRQRIDTERCRETFSTPHDLTTRVVASIHNWENVALGQVQPPRPPAPREFTSDELARQRVILDRAVRKSLKLPVEAPISPAERASVTGLDLTGETEFNDAGMTLLAELTGLRSLVLGNTAVSDAGLTNVSGLTGLWLLNLHSTAVTDAGLADLSGLANLDTLWLYNTAVSDAGLAHLEGLTRLRVLSLQDTDVTSAGIRALRKKLPNCGMGS